MCVCYQFNGSDHCPLPEIHAHTKEWAKPWTKCQQKIYWLNCCGSCLTRLSDKLGNQKTRSRKKEHMWLNGATGECAGTISSPRLQSQFNEMNEWTESERKKMSNRINSQRSTVVWFAPSVIWPMFVAPLRMNLVLSHWMEFGVRVIHEKRRRIGKPVCFFSLGSRYAARINAHTHASARAQTASEQWTHRACWAWLSTDRQTKTYGRIYEKDNVNGTNVRFENIFRFASGTMSHRELIIIIIVFVIVCNSSDVTFENRCDDCGNLKNEIMGFGSRRRSHSRNFSSEKWIQWLPSCAL